MFCVFTSLRQMDLSYCYMSAIYIPRSQYISLKKKKVMRIIYSNFLCIINSFILWDMSFIKSYKETSSCLVVIVSINVVFELCLLWNKHRRVCAGVSSNCVLRRLRDYKSRVTTCPVLIIGTAGKLILTPAYHAVVMLSQQPWMPRREATTTIFKVFGVTQRRKI